MRLFAKVAEVGSFTGAAKALGMPKQTLSRHVAELEGALGVQLLHRTTRRLHVSDAGAAYAERCAEIVRIADEANRAATDVHEVPRGRLRITADPLFGDAFVTDLVVAYARKWPDVGVDVVLTRRRVDLVEEGFDVAFRIGSVDEATTGFRLGPARVRYCASPKYLAHRAAPRTPADLASHECLVVSDAGVARWPFRAHHGKKTQLVAISGRLTFTSFAMARAAALAGLGIAIFPEFACTAELRSKRLVSVLDAWRIDVGSIWFVQAARRFLPARVRAFAELTRAHFRSK